MKKLLFCTLLSCGILNWSAAADETKKEPSAPAPAVVAKPAEDEKKADAAGDKADGDVAKIKLGVIPGTMRFDKTEFTVKPGQKVMILFQNQACPLFHNIIICKPGTKDKVGAEADKMIADPDGLKKCYVPNSTDVLFKGSKLIKAGESDLMEFTAPADEGDYPVLCTFPAHWRLMNAVMKVQK